MRSVETPCVPPSSVTLGRGELDNRGARRTRQRRSRHDDHALADMVTTDLTSPKVHTGVNVATPFMFGARFFHQFPVFLHVADVVVGVDCCGFAPFLLIASAAEEAVTAAVC